MTSDEEREAKRATAHIIHNVLNDAERLPACERARALALASKSIEGSARLLSTIANLLAKGNTWDSCYSAFLKVYAEDL